MKRLPPYILLIVIALFLTASANITFFHELDAVYPWSGNSLFLASVAIAVAAAICLFLAIFSLFLPVRLVVSLFLLTAALAAYFTDQFGTIIDTGMLENILQTDAAEAADLLSWYLVLRLVLLGVVASLVAWRLPLRSPTPLRRSFQLLATATGSLALMAVCILAFSDQYAGFFRQHKVLRSYINPLMPIYSAIRYGEGQLRGSEVHSFSQTAPDAHIEEQDEGSELIILVVGETARRDHFSLNGYHRNTNPELQKESRLISYSDIASCGTSTAVSVPCMFAAAGKDSFDLDSAKYRENLLDILKRAGVNVLWRDNNSSSKGVADRVQYEDFRSADLNPECDQECRDVGMLAGLQEYIDQHSGDILIVLHQMGNHGPAYYKRYPENFERFTPACHSQDFSDCSDADITNAYDNAILYTDYFLSQVISLLKRNTPRYETAMLYVSDHGESLGEHGLYLHGAPYVMAPHEQTDVPILLWLGESADIELEEALAARDKHNTHDAVFHSLLSAFEVETAELDRDNTLFQVGQF